MADDKKKAPAPAGGALFHKDHYKEVIYLVVPGLFVLAYLINRISAFFANLGIYADSPFWSKVFSWLLSFWYNWKTFATILTGAGIVWGIYSFMKLREVEHQEEKIYGVVPNEDLGEVEKADVRKDNDAWAKILEHVHSENPAEWRVAIIDADNMLEEMLRDAGYRGEGVGELLKSVDPSDMLTLDAAWEAHKIRNRIAHAGQDFDLTSREAKRVIGLYESAFKEFGVV